MSPSAFLADPLSLASRLLHLLPAWAAPLRHWPLWGQALLLCGAIPMLVAGTRWRRPMALVGGAGAGWLWGLAVAGALGMNGRLLPPVAAALAAGASLLLPSAFPFALASLPGALLGARMELPGGWPVGAAVGFLLGGGLGLLASRFIAAAAAGLLGGALAGVALLAASRHLPALAILAERPVLLAGLVLGLAAVGAAYQLGRGGSPGGAKPRRRTESPPAAEAQHA